MVSFYWKLSFRSKTINQMDKNVWNWHSGHTLCMFLRNPLGASWATISMGFWSIVLWNFTVKNAVLSSVKHCVKTFILLDWQLLLNNNVDTMALKTFKPWSEYKWSNEMVLMTSLVLILIKNSPMVVPTRSIWGSKKSEIEKVLKIPNDWKYLRSTKLF